MLKIKNVFPLIMALCTGTIWVSGVASQDGPPLRLRQTVDLPGYTGDFDHFAADRQRGRLLLAAEDHGTLEVFDLSTGQQPIGN